MRAGDRPKCDVVVALGPDRVGSCYSSCRVVGAIGLGRSVSPISHVSTPAAHERPSAIAHTMRLCPRPMSPHANTPGTLVMNAASRSTLPRRVEIHGELLEQTFPLRPEEPHRQQHELARQLEVGAFDLLELAVDHLDLVRPQRAHVAVVVGEEALGVDAVDALATLLVRRRHPEHVRPRGPRVGGRPGVGRSGHDLELVHRHRALPVGGAEAVGAGVASADDDDPLALGGDGRRVEVALLHPVAPGQELHGLMDPAVLTSRDRKIAPRGGAPGEHDGVELLAQLLDGDVDPDVHVHPELGALGRASARADGRGGASPS